jgi:hypothetical protein
MEGLRLLAITKEQEYENLIQLGFKLVRNCGKGLTGLLVSLAVCYIDGLILAQGTTQNNCVFIEPT